MTADQAQRDQALDATSSFIVQAPAGSGKTELLIQRYLALLVRVNAPESIVAITFTRKAAAEMAARVLKALREAAENTPVVSLHEQRTRALASEALRRDAALGWELNENPARLQIQTIDSLCVRIAGGMPWIARLGALPRFTEQPEPLYREAARETLRLLALDPGLGASVATLLVHCDNRASLLIDLIAGMLGRRDQWLARSEEARRNPAAARTLFEDHLRQVSAECLERLNHEFPPDLREDTLALARSAASQLPGSPISACVTLTEFAGSDPACIPFWKALAELLITKSGTWRKIPVKGWSRTAREKQLWNRVMAGLNSQDALLSSFRELDHLPPVAFSGAQWEVMTAAFTVLQLAVAQLKILFRGQNEIDFNELNASAVLALGSLEQPTDLALAFGDRIEHLLLDEFQDTSRAQFELIRRLTAGWYTGDGRTLFLVGDPMQSIYRFRQADVSLFEEVRKNGIGDVKLTPLALSANFRSGPGLVSWVNQVFRHVMPADADARLAAVPFSASEATRTGIPARVSVHGFIDDDLGAAQALRALEIIQATPAGQKIGILARTRGNLAAIVRRLRKQAVAFQAVELDSLAERPVIEDLLSLTFALLHPAHRISWLSVLRAPWCGLTLVDLEAIAGEDKSAPVWELLGRNESLLSPGGRVRVERIRPVLEQALQERGGRSLRSLVEDAWRGLGGPQCAGSEADLDDAEAFLALLESLEAGGDLEDFELLRDCAKVLFAEPDPNATEHVQLMTIHKAKGLEFDVVILPELHRHGGKGSRPLVAWMDDERGLLAAPIPPADEEDEPIYDYVSDSERRKEQAEVNRLLYVAATRARCELHLLGSTGRKKDGTLSQPPRDTFLGILWPELMNDFDSSLAVGVPAAVAESPASARLLRRVSESWKTPPFAAPVEWAGSLTASPSSETAVTYDWVGDTLRQVGIVLHAFLQRIAREGLHRWDAAALLRARSAFRAALSNQGVSDEEMEDAVARVEKAIAQCLADPRGRWILGAHRDSQCEVALAGVVAGSIVEARIDRTFLDGKGVRWIIDYKTSSHTGGKTAKFLDDEQERYRAQLEHYAGLFSLDEAGPIKLGLYFPLLGGWREWEAPRASVRPAVQASLFD